MLITIQKTSISLFRMENPFRHPDGLTVCNRLDTSLLASEQYEIHGAREITRLCGGTVLN